MSHQETFGNNVVETTFNTPLVELNCILPAGKPPLNAKDQEGRILAALALR